jgi:site-specific recombinase XerD
MRTKAATKTPTQAPTENRPLAPTEELPKGLSFEDRPGIPMPYLARWREPGGKKKARSFKTAADRASFAKDWAAQRTQWGTSTPVVHPRQAETWRIFDELTHGADPIAVARFWLQFRAERGGLMLLSEARDKFLELREGRNLSRDAQTHIELHLRRLCETFAGKRLCDITTDGLRAWLGEIAKTMSPYTERHHTRSMKLLFKVAVREHWMERSPAAPIELPDVELGEVTTLTIEETTRLFKVNRDHLCIGRLALEAFGGLRFSSAARLRRGELLFKEKGIVMPGRKHKSGRRHYVDEFPSNLWAWLKHAPEACWDLPERIYRDQKAAAFERAKVNNPGNVLRHSFCTYHISQYKDAARTAVLLTHQRPAMLYQHYKGMASAVDGVKYFAIKP